MLSPLTNPSEGMVPSRFIPLVSDIASYADGTTLYEFDQHCDNLINNMEVTVEKFFNWFAFNNLKVNGSKMSLFLMTLSTHFDKH